MTVNLFTFVGLFRKQLGVAGHLLDKGLDHARATGVTEVALLDWRLIDDMQPLRFQFGVVANFAQAWPARAVGLPVPAEIAFDLDVAGIRAALATATTFLDGLTPLPFAERDDVPLTFPIGNGMEPTLPAERWLTGFAATNLYFHLSMVYAILRAKGVPIGKADLFAGEL